MTIVPALARARSPHRLLPRLVGGAMATMLIATASYAPVAIVEASGAAPVTAGVYTVNPMSGDVSYDGNWFRLTSTFYPVAGSLTSLSLLTIDTNNRGSRYIVQLLCGASVVYGSGSLQSNGTYPGAQPGPTVFANITIPANGTTDGCYWQAGNQYPWDVVGVAGQDITYIPSTIGVGPGVQYLGPGTNPNERDQTGRFAEPVNSFSGNYTTGVTDLAIPGRRLPVAFGRTYNSLGSYASPLGPGWAYTYGAGLSFNADGSVVFADGDGAQMLFKPDGAGGYAAAQGVLSTLASVAGSYTVTRHDGFVYAFTGTGRLAGETDRNGNTLAFSYVSGNLSSITDTVGRVISLSYDASNRLTTLSDPIGRTVGYAYDANGRLAAVTDLGGGVTHYTYDSSGRLATIVDQNGHTVVANTYDPASGRVATQADARGDLTTFTWNASTQTATASDARGGVTTDVYSGSALMSRTDAMGDRTVFGYDGSLNLVSVADPRGNSTTMTYDAAGNMLSRTAPSPLSYVESWTYDTANDLLSHTDGRGGVSRYTYDTSGNLTGVSYPDSTTAAYTYDSHGERLTATDQRGKTTTTTYDASAEPVSVSSALGETATMTYDGVGRVLTSVDPRGNVAGGNPAQYTTAFTYDARDHVTSVTDPLGHATSTAYDPAGNRTSVTDPNGHPTTFGYDAADHLTSVTDAAGKVTSYTYDAAGNLVSRTDANNHITTYAYDLAGRLTSTTDPANHTSSVAYDADGNVVGRTDANGKTTTYGYDVLNRLVGTTYADPSTAAVSFSYDANGNRTSMSDGAGTESYTYDLLDRLTGVTRGADAFGYRYDAAGNILSRTYPNGDVTTYAYDSDGRLASATLPGTSLPDTTPPTVPAGVSATAVGPAQISLTWTASTDSGAGVQGYKIYRGGTYLAAVGPVGSTSFTDTGLTPGTAYSYAVSAIDAAGNESAQSGAASATTPQSTDATAPSAPSGVSAAAAAWNQVDLSWAASTDNVGVTSYTVYRDGSELSVVDGSVTKFTDRSTAASAAYAYTVAASDAAGNASAQSGPASVTTPARALGGTVGYAYDAAGDLTSALSPDGVLEKASYDAAGRLLEIANTETGGTLSRFTYALDAAGNRVELTTSLGTTYYAYDSLDRLTGVCTSGACAPAGGAPLPCLACTAGTISRPVATTTPDPSDTFTDYTYDPVGNRLTIADHRGTTSYAYDAADRLTSTSGPAGATSYTYDANGNELTAGSASYTYDLADRMVSATAGGATQTYTWSGDGIRLSAATGPGAGTTEFLVDRNMPLPSVATERDGTGASVRTVFYGASQIALLDSSGATAFEHSDALGSVTDLASPDGASLAWTEYAAFGGVRAAGAVAGAPSDPFGFTGQYLDPTGLYHLRARQYDSSTGRFTSVDPVQLPISDPYVSSYVYGAGNPVRYTDPSGRCLFLCAVIGAVAGAIVGGVTYTLSSGDSFNWGGLAGHAAVGAAAGAIIGFTGGAAAAAALPAFETTVMIGTGGYVAGIAQTAGQVLLGDHVTAQTYVANEASGVLGAVAGGAPEGSWMTDLLSPRALAIDAGSVAVGVVFK